VETHHGKAVETNDFINSIQAVTGKNMRKFFDQWVFGPGHPDYTVQYWWDPKKKSANVRIQQKAVDGNSFFSMPVELEFITSKGKRKFTETLDKKRVSFHYPFDVEPLDFRFDPFYKVPKIAAITKPYKMWVKQLETDPHVVGRIIAAKMIAEVPTKQSLELLGKALKKEKFWGAAKEIAEVLGDTKKETAKKILLQCFDIKNPKARRGVVKGLGYFTTPDVIAKLKQVFLRDSSYFVAGECLKSLMHSDAPDIVAFVEKALKRESWADVVRSHAIKALSRFPHPRSIRILRHYTKYGFHIATRGASLHALVLNAKNFPELFQDLLQLAEDREIRIRHAAISALGRLKNPLAVPVLEKISKDKNLPYRTTSIAQDALLKINPEKG
jgi:aminopeptidase N